MSLTALLYTLWGKYQVPTDKLRYATSNPWPQTFTYPEIWNLYRRTHKYIKTDGSQSACPGSVQLCREELTLPYTCAVRDGKYSWKHSHKSLTFWFQKYSLEYINSRINLVAFELWVWWPVRCVVQVFWLPPWSPSLRTVLYTCNSHDSNQAMDCWFGVWFLACEREFFLLETIQLGSKPHPASYSRGTGVLSPWIKQLGNEVDQLHPSSVEVMNEWNSTSIPTICLSNVDRKTFTLIEVTCHQVFLLHLNTTSMYNH